ncbi:DUF2800 domain-containing protein [Selenomonas sputigena]|uniref:DUF2800 domain-containing protein n=1 Tax=Selenomonas sputigena TaxID=69823 RepID=UPI0022322E4D|nr:DUF2800 domain-containing protein [Selenomonas sputigena]UZD42776.1 DUF2800 domain-containing protein [Selenomonas sputigena]
MSASASKRWLSCPPSARLERKFPDKAGEAAREGTLAHALAEAQIRRYLGEITDEEEALRIETIRDNALYAPEMDEYVSEYVDLCIEKINEAHGTALVEERLDFSRWVKHGFGTGDMVILGDGVLEIVDLKYGKGVPVPAEGNPQMQLYALGAIEQYGCIYDFDHVRMSIFQPRNGGLSTHLISVDDLLAWGEEIKPIAELAYAGKGEFRAGEHCRFCKAAAQCKTLSEYNMEIAKLEFQDADLLTDEEVSLVLSRVDGLVRYAEKIKVFALNEALKGHKWPGYKVVEGRSNRRITDEVKASKLLRKAGYGDDVIYKPLKMQGITELEKALTKKKFTTLLGSVVEKPPGKPTLVSEEDERPEYGSAKNEFEIMEEDTNE